MLFTNDTSSFNVESSNVLLQEVAKAVPLNALKLNKKDIQTTFNTTAKKAFLGTYVYKPFNCLVCNE